MDKKILKLSKTLSLTEARYASALGFDFIGFCFDKNDPNYITPVKAKEIMNWVSGPEMVAEFHENPSVEEIENIISILGFEYIELNDENLIEKFSKSDIKVIAYNVSSKDTEFEINSTEDNNQNQVIEISGSIDKKGISDILNNHKGISIIGKGDYETGFSDTDLMDVLQEILDEE